MNQIKKDITWAGYIDWDLRNFHGYETPSGSTYNAYLINDEKPVLIDAVKDYGAREMLRRIRQVMDPSRIQYVISNHTEMDHSGAIDEVLQHCPNAQVVCSPKGEEGLKRHFKKNWNFKVVQTGDELNIGKRTLKFHLMPMVHWPDSMATYCPEDKILFPNDAFGQHYASSERYAHEVGDDIVFAEAAKYYANIVMPYGKQVLQVLDAVEGLDIDAICPSHGLIWHTKEDIQKILSLYRRWASYEADNKVLIVYDSMWHSTEKMAKRLYALLDGAGVPVKIMNLQISHISDIVTEVLFSRMVLFGSPILNNRMLPTMAALVMYLKGLKTKNRLAAVFGSYGWATVGFKELEASLAEAGFTLFREGTYIRFIPDENDLKALEAWVPEIQEQLGVKS